MQRAVIGIAAIALTAALALSPSAQGAGPIVGKYRGKITSGFLAGTWTIDFRRNKTYKVTSRFGTLTGKIRYSGSTTITFYGESEGTICPGAGKYKFRKRGRTLKFTAIREPCRPRRLVKTTPLYRRIR